jgi:23S rRNA (uracil1939-C5)-methyltransferase
MRRKARRGGGRQLELTIAELGARGDGLAEVDGRPVFVPFALPGETVRVRLTGEKAAGYKGELLEVMTPAAERVEAPCPHYGPCGGCSVQHLADAAYVAWKHGLVGQALGRRGFAQPPVGELVRVPARSRRRASLAARLLGGQAALGFHGRESHELESIETCQVLHPELTALLPDLRRALRPLLSAKETAEVALLVADTGIDLLVASRQAPGLEARQALAALAEDRDLARVSWRPVAGGAGVEPEPVAVRRPVAVQLGGVRVEPPPGAFLQPSAAGEAALVQAVRDWLGDVKGPVADLYAGLGTFTFPLAERGPVHSVEGAEPAMAALWQAARKHDLAGRVTAEVRDLAEDPPDPEVLSGFAGVVFDPPRAGAKALSQALAESDVPTVAALSCNPNTFARDARTLVDGGYRLEAVRPIDQFPWSGHVELAALFRRPAAA